MKPLESNNLSSRGLSTQGISTKGGPSAVSNQWDYISTAMNQSEKQKHHTFTNKAIPLVHVSDHDNVTLRVSVEATQLFSKRSN